MGIVLLRSAVMEAVVTGSAGFIGSHLVHALIERGYRITGIDRQPRSEMPGYRHTVLDLARNPVDTGVAEQVARADIVFHLAARPGVRGGGAALQRMRVRDNVVAAQRLLSVTPCATPVVATSSSSVYGGSQIGVPSREDDPLRPRGGYARSKVDMERLCALHRSRGGIVAVIRPFTVAGEGQRPDMAFSIWAEAVRSGDPIELFGSEDRSRDITDIRDVVEGLILAGERQLNETVNLGSGVTHRLIDLARAVIDVSGRDTGIVTSHGSSEEVDITIADTGRCARLLGFVPKTDIRALIGRQIEATAATTAMVLT
jgi:nucleoside-diphosphate-sugar epimerase